MSDRYALIPALTECANEHGWVARRAESSETRIVLTIEFEPCPATQGDHRCELSAGHTSAHRCEARWTDIEGGGRVDDLTSTSSEVSR